MLETQQKQSIEALMQYVSKAEVDLLRNHKHVVVQLAEANLHRLKSEQRRRFIDAKIREIRSLAGLADAENELRRAVERAQDIEVILEFDRLARQTQKRQAALQLAEVESELENQELTAENARLRLEVENERLRRELEGLKASSTENQERTRKQRKPKAERLKKLDDWWEAESKKLVEQGYDENSMFYKDQHREFMSKRIQVTTGSS